MNRSKTETYLIINDHENNKNQKSIDCNGL